MNPRFLAPWLLVGACLAACQTMDTPPAAEAPEPTHLGHEPVFREADTDGDGKLSAHEIALHHHREEMATLDLDNDNHVSRSEWQSAHPSLAESDEHFNRLDKDGDGHVCQDEAVLFVTEHVEFGDQMSEFDANGDFHLHWEEIDAGAPTELRITLLSLHPGV